MKIRKKKASRPIEEVLSPEGASEEPLELIAALAKLQAARAKWRSSNYLGEPAPKPRRNRRPPPPKPTARKTDFTIDLTSQMSDIEPYIWFDDNLYGQLTLLNGVIATILSNPETSRQLSALYCQPLLEMVFHILQPEDVVGGWLAVSRDSEEWPQSEEDVDQAHEIVEQIGQWTWDFAHRWNMITDEVTDVGAVDPEAVPVGWFDLSNSTSLRSIAEDTTAAAETFLRHWQRCELVRDPRFLFDEDQRQRLVQACEALIGVLRAEMVERNLAATVGKRAKLAELAIAAAIGFIGGASSGLTQGAVEALSPLAIAEAQSTEAAARNLTLCLTALDRSISASAPPAAQAAGPAAHPRS